MSENQEPNIHVVEPQSVQSVSRELQNYSSKSNPLINSEMDLYAHFYKHEDIFVYQELALYFQDLGAER